MKFRKTIFLLVMAIFMSTVLSGCFPDPVVNDIKNYNDNTLSQVGTQVLTFINEFKTITEKTNKKETIMKIDNVLLPTSTQALEAVLRATPKTEAVRKINSDLLRAVKSLNESQKMAKEAYSNMDEAKYNASEIKRRDSIKSIMQTFNDFEKLALKYKINLLALRGYYDTTLEE
jgi:hypothetical protein